MYIKIATNAKIYDITGRNFPCVIGGYDAAHKLLSMPDLIQLLYSGFDKGFGFNQMVDNTPNTRKMIANKINQVPNLDFFELEHVMGGGGVELSTTNV